MRTILRKIFKAQSLSTDRLEAFTDGIMAFAVTVLVLEISVPHLESPASAMELLYRLRAQVPKFLIYTITFVVLIVWWVAHHHLFETIKRSDRALLLLNSIFLLFIAFSPFPTALLGDYPENPAAAVFYGIVGAFTGLSFFAVRWYAGYPGQLQESQVTEFTRRRALRRSLGSPVFYFVGAVIGVFWPVVSLVVYGAIPLYFTFSWETDPKTKSTD